MTVSEHVYRAFLIGTPDRELSVQGGRISLDASRSPRITAILEVKTGSWVGELTLYPDEGFGEGPFGETGFGGYYEAPVWDGGLDTLAGLDPRENARVRIEVTSTGPYGPQSRSFDLGVRERPIDFRNATVTLDLASDEELLEDWAPLADDTAPLALAGSLRDVIEYVLDIVLPGTTLEASPSIDADLTPAPGGAEDDAFTWRAGQSAMDFLHPLCQVAGYRLICDEERKWTLRDETYLVPGSVAIRYGVNMIDAGENISRSSGIWGDAAATIHTWTDSAGLEQIRVDSFALNTPYTKVLLFERSTPYPGPGFSEYIVRRAQQRGREVSGAMVSDWRADPEQSLTIVLLDTPTQTGIIESLEFSLDNDEMTVTSRTIDTPDAAWVLIPEGESWLDSPLGESWIDEVI